MPDYGTDLSCDTDFDPQGKVVSGTELMAQVCVRRLFCRKGQLLSDPLYGIDLRDLLGSKIALSAADVTRIQSLASSELLQDERVDTVDAIASFDTQTKVFTLTLKGTGAQGPFSLVLSVANGDVTAQTLAPI